MAYIILTLPEADAKELHSWDWSELLDTTVTGADAFDTTDELYEAVKRVHES